MTDHYHLRRSDKLLADQAEIERVLISTRYVSVAMCREQKPYLVVLNHGFDRARRCLYFHCAGKGRKMDILAVNPRVWGIAVEDLGYKDGDCDHAYRSVMFGGRVTFITDDEEKRSALEVMIRQQESDPERVMAEQLKPGQVAAVTIGRIDIDQWTGKQAL